MRKVALITGVTGQDSLSSGILKKKDTMFMVLQEDILFEYCTNRSFL